MRLGFILITGVFFNMLMASIFPFQLLDFDTATYLMGSDSISYDFDNNQYFTDQYKQDITTYQDSNTREDMLALTDTGGGVVTNPLEALGSFFDGLLDSLTKAKTYLAFLIPYSTLFYLLPGALGLIIGSLYSAVFGYAIVRFIRGA